MISSCQVVAIFTKRRISRALVALHLPRSSPMVVQFRLARPIGLLSFVEPHSASFDSSGRRIGPDNRLSQILDHC